MTTELPYKVEGLGKKQRTQIRQALQESGAVYLLPYSKTCDCILGGSEPIERQGELTEADTQRVMGYLGTNYVKLDSSDEICVRFPKERIKVIDLVQKVISGAKK